MTARYGCIDKSRPERDREQFQEKCIAVFRPELRRNKGWERFRISVKNGNAPVAVFSGDVA
ncbi:hypothetical protein C1M53_28440 [Mesorhizobium sp. Pch-S]|nr:hypothetical protein C1M53_28440 [Mesorhizobium sp. Pch-S]